MVQKEDLDHIRLQLLIEPIPQNAFSIAYDMCMYLICITINKSLDLVVVISSKIPIQP